jgi:hypothetical protein
MGIEFLALKGNAVKDFLPGNWGFAKLGNILNKPDSPYTTH